MHDGVFVIKALKYIILVVVIFVVYSSYKDRSKAVEYANLSIPLLNDVSSDWSLTNLKKHLHPFSYETSQHVYKKMMENAKSLGKFKSCKDLSMGTTEDGIEAISGECQFENDTAEVTIMFMEIKAESAVVGLLIK